MYSAKESGRASFQFYTDQMQIDAHERVALEKDLREALKNREFLLHYQPQIDVPTRQVVGVEALIRWQLPYTGLILPNTFNPVAEATGLNVPIGCWVIGEACRQLSHWRNDGFEDLTMAINLSIRQLLQNDLIENIINAIKESDIPALKLEFEITESMMMENVEETIDRLYKIKSLGVKRSMDDYGAEYSALSYLKRFPLNKLKIDKSFVDGLPEDNNGLAIVQSIIGITHSLNLKVIAEGVETEGQYKLLAHHQCNGVQGYYFSKPLSATDANQFLIKKENELA